MMDVGDLIICKPTEPVTLSIYPGYVYIVLEKEERRAFPMLVDTPVEFLLTVADAITLQPVAGRYFSWRFEPVANVARGEIKFEIKV